MKIQDAFKDFKSLSIKIQEYMLKQEASDFEGEKIFPDSVISIHQETGEVFVHTKQASYSSLSNSEYAHQKAATNLASRYANFQDKFLSVRNIIKIAEDQSDKSIEQKFTSMNLTATAATATTLPAYQNGDSTTENDYSLSAICSKHNIELKELSEPAKKLLRKCESSYKVFYENKDKKTKKLNSKEQHLQDDLLSQIEDLKRKDPNTRTKIIHVIADYIAGMQKIIAHRAEP